MNGGFGRDVKGVLDTSVTVNSWPVHACARDTAAASVRISAPSRVHCPRSSKSRPVATRTPSTAVSRAGKSPGCRRAWTSQYPAGTKAMRSRSRSTISLVATDCTRPALSCGWTFFHSTGETS